MFSTLKAVRLGFSLLLEVVRWLQAKQLLDAGEARAISAGLEQARRECDAVIKGRQNYRDARRRGDIGDDDNDGYRRD